ncbi:MULTISPECIES: hypothetical protein [unclassified Streptomyces]|uniref:hypothetical protein n=1 Tax=unclassified Streptomyces TaxID=2593676 RepID=UPI00336ABCD3
MLLRLRCTGDVARAYVDASVRDGLEAARTRTAVETAELVAVPRTAVRAKGADLPG